MEENQVVDRAEPAATSSAQRTADRIIREAEARRTQKAASVGSDDPAPFSEALGIPTLLNETKTGSEEMKRETAASVADEPPEREKKSSSAADEDVYVSSKLGLPLLTNSPTPLSSALNIPTLINESRPARSE